VVLWLVHDPGLHGDLGWISVGVLFYLGDFIRASGDQMIVLGHTWSLAVEEQFYLLWPAVLVVLLRRGRRPPDLFVVVASAAATLAVWRVAAGLAWGFDRVYFAPDTNAFALLCGCALACRPLRLQPGTSRVVIWASTALLVAISILPIRSGQTYHQILVLGAPFVGVVAIAAVGTASSNSRLLANPILMFFGQISYGLYLWHEVFLLSHPHGHPLTSLELVLGGIAGIVAGTMSWYCIEAPCLAVKQRFVRVDEAAAVEGSQRQPSIRQTQLTP
jgi:peptidoglycan/LPS O-acetylase OafA/YrhL